MYPSPIFEAPQSSAQQEHAFKASGFHVDVCTMMRSVHPEEVERGIEELRRSEGYVRGDPSEKERLEQATVASIVRSFPISELERARRLIHQSSDSAQVTIARKPLSRRGS